jgi:hypothetical protein
VKGYDVEPNNRHEFELLRKQIEIMFLDLIMRVGALWLATVVVLFFAVKLH